MVNVVRSRPSPEAAMVSSTGTPTGEQLSGSDTLHSSLLSQSFPLRPDNYVLSTLQCPGRPMEQREVDGRGPGMMELVIPGGGVGLEGL